MAAEVCDAFQKRPHIVDQAPGFVRMEVFTPIDCPEEFWLVTHWENEEHFKSWHRGHTYREAHKNIPKGLKLDAKQTELRFFKQICS